MERKIFVVREPRCGGSMLSAYIGNAYFKKHSQTISPNNWCDTHDFNIFENEIIKHNNPFVVRIDRKNLTEHFLSKRAIKIVNNSFTNLTPEKPNHVLWDRIKISKVTIDIREVQLYIEEKILLELRVRKLVKDFNIPYHKIWYEDAMHNLFDIPKLELYNLDIKKEGTGTTYQLPDYKRDVFTNYDQVSKWMNKFKDAYIKKHNLAELLEHWSSDTSC